jgi:hypothetical protein
MEGWMNGRVDEVGAGNGGWELNHANPSGEIAVLLGWELVVLRISIPTA